MARLAEEVYGEALFLLARESGQIDERQKEAEGIRKALAEEKEFMQWMTRQGVEQEDKEAVLIQIFSKTVSEEMCRFLQLVVRKDHFKEIDGILSCFLIKVKEYKRIGVVFVTTAAELSERQKKALKQRLLETTDYLSLELHITIDPSLIGGMVIRIGDRIVDGSVKTRLTKLSAELSKIQWKAGEGAP